MATIEHDLGWRVELAATAVKATRQTRQGGSPAHHHVPAPAARDARRPAQRRQALTGPKLGIYWRYRVGDYRLICAVEDGVLRILVLEIGNRRDHYR
jgi:mRNA interferase RelE/StbE